MSELKNDTFLRALLRKPVDYTPIWIMRQAGRYLPEYRKTRAQAGDFMSLCKNKDLACEVTIQPLERFELDAAILFSDILTIPDAMGLGLYFEAGEGPKFKKTIESQADIDALFIPKMDDELKYVMEAVSTIRHELNGRVPLIGFSGSPWTLATYMIEGGSSKDYRKTKAMMYSNPQMLHQVLDLLARSIIDYLNAQIKAGAQAVQVFDSWGGVLSPEMYREFSLKYMQKIVDGLLRENEGRKVPVILFSKGAEMQAKAIANTGCDAMGVSWTTDLSTVKSLTDSRIALQGNLDPSVLYASPDVIRREVKTVLDSYGDDPTGHVFNLGHGVHQFVNAENVKVLVDCVHELSVK